MRTQTIALTAIATTTIQPYHPVLKTGAASKFAVTERGIIPAERIQLSVRPNHVRAAAIDSVLIPGQGVHKRLDEQPKGMRLVEFELFQQLPQRLRFATAPPQVLQVVTHFIAQERLHRPKVEEITYRADASADFQQVSYGRAVGIAARQRSKILKAQLPVRLRHRCHNDVGCVQSFTPS